MWATPAYSVLGHVSFEGLSECLSCHVSKSVALPFNRSIACTKDAMDLVHTFSDLPPNLSKEAVFIDDYACCTWVYLMKYKHKLYDIFYFLMVDTQFSSRIKTFKYKFKANIFHSRFCNFLSHQ